MKKTLAQITDEHKEIIDEMAALEREEQIDLQEFNQRRQARQVKFVQLNNQRLKLEGQMELLQPEQ